MGRGSKATRGAADGERCDSQRYGATLCRSSVRRASRACTTPRSRHGHSSVPHATHVTCKPRRGADTGGEADRESFLERMESVVSEYAGVAQPQAGGVSWNPPTREALRRAVSSTPVHAHVTPLSALRSG